MLATAAFGRRVSARLSRILPGRPSRWRRLVSGTTRKDRTRGSRTLSVCTTTAGRRLSTRTHHTSPRRGSSSPFVVTVLLSHPSSLMPAPRRFVSHDVPAVAIQVFPGLLTDALRLEQVVPYVLPVKNTEGFISRPGSPGVCAGGCRCGAARDRGRARPRTAPAQLWPAQERRAPAAAVDGRRRGSRARPRDPRPGGRRRWTYNDKRSMRRSVQPIPALLASLIVAAAGGQPTETGSVAGHVKLTPRIKGSALPSTAYPTRAVGGSDTHAMPEIRNVVVYLKGVAFHGPLPPAKAVLRQEHETFVPHVLPITRGSTVEYPNDDPIFHNVFSLSSAASFDLRRYRRGQSRSHVFPKPGIVKVYCHIHSHMSATILVLDHPYFTIPGTDGTFELPNVPPGEYTVVGWHERVGEQHARVRVERGKAATVDLSLPVEDPR